MSISTPLYNQLFSLLSRPRQLLQVGEPAQRTASQHSKYRDLRHLKTLAWMINALICSGKISLSEWECYIPSRATKAQSFERRWQRCLGNQRIRVRALYVRLVLGAIKNWRYSSWHYCLRLPCDVTIHGARRHPIELIFPYLQIE